MMNEIIFLGSRAVDAGHRVHYRGRSIGVSESDVGLGDVGDLLAYRQMWEPFIGAHLQQWRNVNEILERAFRDQCPPGIFESAQIENLPPLPEAMSTVRKQFCAALALSRMYTSETHPYGILPQWNAWKDSSSMEILAGAKPMLEHHQDVVMRVGGVDKDNLVRISKDWGIRIELPDLPSFSTQQEVIARIEGAYVSLKGVLQIIGYGAGEAVKKVADVSEAVAEGLVDTAKQLPKTTRWIGIAAVVAAVVVGGALIIYYVPKRKSAVRSIPAPLAGAYHFGGS
jgi:hypothetical protein